jgi:hypothetical protein
VYDTWDYWVLGLLSSSVILRNVKNTILQKQMPFPKHAIWYSYWAMNKVQKPENSEL